MSRVRSIIALELNPGLSIVGTPPTLTLGAAYSFAFLPNAGQPPYRWAEAGSLPGGVTWTASTATLSASSVSSAGDFPVTITLADANRKQVSRTFTLHAVALPLTLSGHVANGTIGAAPSGSYSSGGGYGAKTYAITGGTFPAGLALNSSTGAVTGTYTTGASYAWTVEVTDSLSATASINDSNSVGYATLTLAGPFPDAQVGVPYSQYVLIGGGNGVNSLPTGTATGVDGVDAGTLPPGLSLSIVSTTHYLLAGTTTGASAGSISFSVASGDGQRAARSQTFTVASAPTYRYWRILVTGTGSGYVGLGFVEMASAIGGATECNLTDATAGAATASSNYSANPPYRSFNPALGVESWYSDGSGPPASCTYDFGSSPKSIKELRLTRSQVNSGIYARWPTSFLYQHSNDNSTWSTVYSASGLDWSVNPSSDVMIAFSGW